MFLLNKKTRLFNLKKKIQIYFRTKYKKLVFGLYVKIIKSILSVEKKSRFVKIKNKKSDLFFILNKIRKRFPFIRGLHPWNKPMLLALNKTNKTSLLMNQTNKTSLLMTFFFISKSAMLKKIQICI